MLNDAELQLLEERVRYDLTSAGFTPLPLQREDDPEGGLLVFTDRGKVVVAWACHDRLGDAALDMHEANRHQECVVLRHQTVGATMHIALVSLLTGFGYSIHVSGFGSGIEIVPTEF